MFMQVNSKRAHDRVRFCGLKAPHSGCWQSVRDQDVSPLPRIRSTERGVYAGRSNAVRRGSPHLTSPVTAHSAYFATQQVWRYAATLAGSAAICRSVPYY
jgi:hypothetical protein